MKDFLARFIPARPGPVVDMEGHTIGEHEGAQFYTIGQRHGFKTEGVEGRQQYVVAVDTVHNTLRVSSRREDAARSDVMLSEVRWTGHAPKLPLACEAGARYRENPFHVEAEEIKGGMRVTFKEPHIAAPGQSLVFYEGSRCLGGGIIRL